MAFQTESQTTLNEENQITSISENADTVNLKLHIDDARLILSDLLDYEKVDSLLNIYVEKDSVNLSIIEKQNIIIQTKDSQIDDYKLKIENYKKVIKNKDSEIGILLKNIEVLEKRLKKEIRKKRWAIAGAIAGPVVTALIMGITLGK